MTRIFTLLLFIGSLYGQAPDTLFTRTFGDVGNGKNTISAPLESNEWVLKEIKSLRMKRNVSFVFAGVIAGTGQYLRSLADKQYTDYQVARSDAGELRDQIETNDSLAPVFFGASGVSLSVPFYYQHKIEKLERMSAE